MSGRLKNGCSAAGAQPPHLKFGKYEENVIIFFH